MKLLRAAAVAAIALASTAHAQGKSQAKGDMTFFVTSVGGGNGASLGGLDGADKHCNELAKAAGSKHDNWHAYLSTTAPGGEAGRTSPTCIPTRTTSTRTPRSRRRASK